jgi:hypothetical protein
MVTAMLLAINHLVNLGKWWVSSKFSIVKKKLFLDNTNLELAFLVIKSHKDH